jgi:tripeptidyl-peptidase-1
VSQLIKPSDDALDDVHDWLERYGVERAKLSYSSAKAWIETQLPVGGIERLFHTQYLIYKHADGAQLVCAAVWSISSHLHQHIAIVQPTNSFFRLEPHRGSPGLVQPNIEIRAEPSPCQKEVLKVSMKATLAQVCTATLFCLRAIYGTVDYVPKVPGKNRVALHKYDGQTSNRSDVAPCLSQHRPGAVFAAQTSTIDVLSGGADQHSPINAIQAEAGSNIEGNLDAVILLSFGYPTPLIACNTGGELPYQEKCI